MSQETITVAYVNPPAEGKKQATIKTSAGAIYGIAPDKTSYFQVGQTYTVEIAAREFQGRTYKTIKSIVSKQGGNGSSAPSGRPSHMTSEEMFITGVLGRCYQGTGSLPDRVTLTMNIRNLRGAFRDGLAADVTQKPAVEQGGFEEEELPGDWR